MLDYRLSKQALRFLKRIPTKHAKQIVEKIEKLAANPHDVQAEQLEGYPDLKRFKSGEYRCIYRVTDEQIVLLVLRIGKRNGGEVYKNLGDIATEK